MRVRPRLLSSGMWHRVNWYIA